MSTKCSFPAFHLVDVNWFSWSEIENFWVNETKTYLIAFLENIFTFDIKIDRLNWLKPLVEYKSSHPPKVDLAFLPPKSLLILELFPFSFIAFFLFFEKKNRLFCDLIYLSSFLWSGFHYFSFVCDVGWWLFWWKTRLIECAVFNP